MTVGHPKTATTTTTRMKLHRYVVIVGYAQLQDMHSSYTTNLYCINIVLHAYACKHSVSYLASVLASIVQQCVSSARVVLYKCTNIIQSIINAKHTAAISVAACC
jgi:hypothetical protein